MPSSSCRWSSATAIAGRNRPFSTQISPDQGYCSACRLHRPKGAHRDPSRPQISPEQGTQCTLSSATATVGSNRSFSSQVSPDRSIECMSPSPPTQTLPPTRNATAQPGSSWPRRREAFLPLARSYRMKGMLRASLYCRGRRGRHCREDCDSATARRRQRAAITLVSRVGRCYPEE
jgi:hypothetical protein